MAAYVSSARAFFDDLNGRPDPFAYLSGLVNQSDPFFEEEWIDFKGEPQDDKDAKKIWSKALSGYANLTDGLVVWGIDARKQAPRDIDAACGLRLIADPAAFESKLREWIRDATNPPVMGVEYQSYPGPNGEGFAVCFVPQSGHKPHRAEWAGKHYYYRTGDDFLIAEPAILRLLFYPRYEPRFEVEATLCYFNNTGPSHTVTKVKVSASITNKGNGSAYDPCIIAVLQRGATGLPSPWLLNASNWHQMSMEPSRLMITGSVPLHPDFPLTFMGSNDWNAPQRLIGHRLFPKFDPFAIEFSVFSRDSSKKVLTVEFSEDDLLHSDKCKKICT